MKKLTREMLYSLQTYTEMRPVFRQKVIEHKKNRILKLGEYASLHFEDALTLQYRVQEILWHERIEKVEAVEEELQAYNVLIPDGANWKATLILDYVDEQQRHQAFTLLQGIEHCIWVQTQSFSRVFGIANEDLECDALQMTGAVHFLRFELNAAMCLAIKRGAQLAVGIEHGAYYALVHELTPGMRDALAGDLI